MSLPRDQTSYPVQNLALLPSCPSPPYLPSLLHTFLSPSSLIFSHGNPFPPLLPLPCIPLISPHLFLDFFLFLTLSPRHPALGYSSLSMSSVQTPSLSFSHPFARLPFFLRISPSCPPSPCILFFIVSLHFTLLAPFHALLHAVLLRL